MKFLIDENVSFAVVEKLRALGHEAKSVASSGLVGATDRDVFRTAVERECVLLTRDYHFTNQLLFPASATMGVIYIRQGNLRSEEEADLIEQIIKQHPTEIIRGKLVTIYKKLVTIR